MTPEEAKQKAIELLDIIRQRSALDCPLDGEEEIAAALLEAAGRWLSLKDAPTDKPVLVYDAAAKRCVVAQHMTAMEDGSTAWVYARQIGMPGEAFAFIAKHPTHFRYLPEAPEAST
mgnify:CR=1 FL=1